MDSAKLNARHQHRHDGAEYRRIELITGTSRRRQWTPAEKAALVSESLQPGMGVSDVARRYGVSRGLLQIWRRTAMRMAVDQSSVFVPLRIADEPPTTPVDLAADGAVATGAGLIELEAMACGSAFLARSILPRCVSCSAISDGGIDPRCAAAAGVADHGGVQAGRLS